MHEEVILVDESDRQTGVMEKMEAHRKALLHRAFSIFLFDSRGNMLLQRRAAGKYHSPGLWTNACCSHPRPGEDTAQAALRRLSEELGITTKLEKVFDFIYKAPLENGLTEFEFDHVYAGIYDDAVFPDPREVSEIRYLEPAAIRSELAGNPGAYTAWFHLAFPRVEEWRKRNQEP